MDMIFSICSASIELGAIYSIVVIGLALSFRIVNFIDLTIESSFTTGAAITAVALNYNMSSVISLFFAFFCGAISGFITATLHVKFKINKLLSGIIMLTVLYSINLRIMGKSNFPLFDFVCIFDNNSQAIRNLILIFILLLIFSVLCCFLKTSFGFFLRATGENSGIVTKHGKDTGLFIITGLMLSNALTAFSGALAAQNQGFSDIGMGNGLIITSVAALVIGETVLPPTNIPRLILSAVIGSFMYQMIIAIGLRLGINPWDLKIATGILLALSVIVKKEINKDNSNLNIGSESL